MNEPARVYVDEGSRIAFAVTDFVRAAIQQQPDVVPATRKAVDTMLEVAIAVRRRNR